MAAPWPRLPKGQTPEDATLEAALPLLEQKKKAGGRKAPARKAAAKPKAAPCERPRAQACLFEKSPARVTLPDRDRLLAFVAERDGPVDRKEIARVFRLKGAERAALRDLLRELEAEGALDRRRGRRVASGLPEVTVVEGSRTHGGWRPSGAPCGTPGRARTGDNRR